LTVKTQH